MERENSLLKHLRTTDTFIKVITKNMAMISGSLFLGLAFYLTVDVTSRKLGGPFTGVTDEISSYIFAYGGTWALAYALVQGAHVRIDVLFHFYSLKVRNILNSVTLFLTAAFVSVLANEMWKVAIESFRIHATGPQGILQFPIGIPQGLAAIGFSVLVIQALTMLLIEMFGSERSR